ncbi:XdhC family protein [Ignatzschineria rhizosphaerae]|uniref:XdhC family protein n=1 Tax=Ignatzschineria rhizosphaerae TaxID=2923279 RepID=A0ABY3X5E2_9GAMM|nr:XdhC family protein [Ignatzschineria rhizosphaerae]UNM95971.1 XdhC family protein [Ignatzschineria rhizosphaerae]
MKTLDLLVIDTALMWVQEHREIWLCTVLHTYGSAPRSPGALFAATDQGHYVGSLSGGCIEEDFLQKLQEKFFLKESEVITYGEQSELFRPTTKLPCGGTIDVLVEYLSPSSETDHYLKMMQAAISGKTEKLKIVNLGDKAYLEDLPEKQQGNIVYNETHIEIRLQSFTTLFIAGISAVALYCIDFALSLGFSVVVADDRPEELRQLKESPSIDKITLLETFPAQYLETNGATSQTAIISLTHDPRIDDFTMIAALETPAFYIGAMGSKRNSEHRFARLRECTDFTQETLSRIKAPIGIPIGSKTPAEIALSIMADIVQSKNLQSS